MLRQNKKEWIKKFKYQLSEWLPYGSFDHIMNSIINHEGEYGKDFIQRGNNRTGYAVFTEGKNMVQAS